MDELNGQPPPNRSSSKQQVHWRRMFLYTIVPASAAAVLGGTVGILTGSSDHDADVLAATLPAVLSVGGVAAYVIVTRENEAGKDKRLTWAVSSLVILFSLALLVGSHIGAYARNVYDTDTRDIVEDYLQKRYIRKIMNCSILQFQINDRRKHLNLPPLTIQQICPVVQAGSPSQTLRPTGIDSGIGTNLR